MEEFYHSVRLIQMSDVIFIQHYQKQEELCKMKQEKDMTNHNQIIGKWGEKIALEYLRQNGYEVLETNHRTPFGEIDIVAREGGMIVFIEVKTRTSTVMGNPEGSVTPMKQQHLINSALHYISDLCEPNPDWRVDVVAIIGNPRTGCQDLQVFVNAVQI